MAWAWDLLSMQETEDRNGLKLEHQQLISPFTTYDEGDSL